MIRTLATIAFATALLTVPFTTVTSAPREAPDVSNLKSATATQITKSLRRTGAILPDDNGQPARYIVQFEGDAMPLALAKSNSRSNRDRRVNTRSAEARALVNQLRSQQRVMLAKISAEAGAIEVVRTHQHALNAATIRMSVATARKVQRMPGVRSVEPDQTFELTTATSVPFIGADQVWDGSASGGIGYLGEGIVVGIIDSGINHGHPSFAATGDDGYTHTNPLGEGNYLGDCEDFAGLCNSKLIGAYSFLDGQTSVPPDEILIEGDPPSTDTDGHGSHVASTAAGNILYDIALPDADGNPGSIVFDQISGVAPHANVVAFKVCAPSCTSADIVASVDQAIEDGVVDVLNHSISSGPGSPWNSAQAIAFLNARTAGIFVANSAGNSGPGAGTAEAGGNAPWAAAVAATTHDRSYPPKFLQDMSGGDTAAPADITGASVSGGITATIVYAGDFPTDNGSANDTEPEQCLDPFPEGTFTSDQIVMCDRGAIARVAKGQNVRDGGAGGFILGNTDGGATSVNNDSHVIPAIHINAADAGVVRGWLASGEGHTGTITTVDSAITDPAAGDNLADFSSRGPYTGFDILAPNTAAPGVDILAAGAELTQEQIDLMGEIYNPPSDFPSVGGSYGAIGGTSMSSPHIAGTAALLKQAQPDWTDAEVLSAIMTTGSYDLVKEDGVTPADPHDFGGGRVQLPLAVQAGLLLDESSANFEAANPDIGGDPATLNVAGLVKESCLQSCSWTRAVKAPEGGSWDVVTSDPGITVSPETFTLGAGETQSLEITASSAGFPVGEWVFGRVDLVSTTDMPTQHLTLAYVPSTGELPSQVLAVAGRDADSYLVEGIQSIEITDLQVAVGGLAAATNTDMSLEGDSNNSSPYDDLSDGVDFVLLPSAAGPVRVVAFTENATSESPDLDLFVGFDSNGNGFPDESEELCVSAGGTASERCDFAATSEAGNWWVLVQNWGPSDTPPDALVLTTALVDSDLGNLTVDAPSSVPELTPFDIRLIWDLPGSVEGDGFYGTITLGSDAANPDNIGTIPVTITRGADDVSYSVSSNSAQPGDTLTFSIAVAANQTPEDRNYGIAAVVPDGFSLVPDSITGGGVAAGNIIGWNVAQASLAGTPPSYEVITSNEDPACAMPFATDGGYADLEQFGIFPDPGVTGDTVTFGAFGGQNFNFYGDSFTGGFSFTDDGFAFFGDSTPGPNPWVNQPIPSGDDPNSLMAILWRDFIIPTPDTTPGAVVGVSLGSAGPDLSVIEYDNMEAWPGGGGDSIDFQLGMIGFVDDSPGAYEIIMAFDNVDDGGNPFGTIGVEDSAGANGTQYAFDDVALSDGLAICFDLVGPSIEPTALTYQVTVDAETAGTTVVSAMRSSVDSVGSEIVPEIQVVNVAAPGDINGDGVVDTDDILEIYAARNTPADGENDPRDMNGDGVINMQDARLVVLECTLPNCAVPGPG